MLDLTLTETENLDKELVARVQAFNQSAQKLTEQEQALKSRQSELFQEVAEPLGDQEERPTAKIVADWSKCRLSQLDSLRQRRKLTMERANLLNEIVPVIESRVENSAAKVEASIAKAKALLTEAGAGIGSFQANGSAKPLVAVDPKAAEIQFTHRAKQTEVYKDAVAQHEQCEDSLIQVVSQQAATGREADSLPSRLRDAWNSISSTSCTF